MVLGDGIRRNIATVDEEERGLFRDALIALHAEFHFAGSREDRPAGGVSYWFKQDEIHQGTHVHGGPAFLTWHRELVNRFEGLLHLFDNSLSLHYWDWNDDPTAIKLDNGETLNLFTEDFMGQAHGLAGDPWLKNGFYNPNPEGDN